MRTVHDLDTDGPIVITAGGHARPLNSPAPAVDPVRLALARNRARVFVSID